MNYTNAEALVRNFIENDLNGNIDDLIKFSFSKIYDDKKFGNAYGINDGDRTKLAIAIYFLLWKDKDIPNFNESNFDKYKNSYSGETINTFNTLFGKGEDDRKRILKIFSNEERIRIDDFKDNIYQKLGNFMILPKNTIFYRKSINSYKGTNKIYKDYFDIFLRELNKCLLHDSKCDPVLERLIDKNTFFFKKINCIDEFLECFDLNCYKDFNLGEKHFSHWEWNQNNSDEYRKFALMYIDKTTELIDSRTKFMVNKLKTILKI